MAFRNSPWWHKRNQMFHFCNIFQRPSARPNAFRKKWKMDCCAKFWQRNNWKLTLNPSNTSASVWSSPRTLYISFRFYSDFLSNIHRTSLHSQGDLLSLSTPNMMRLFPWAAVTNYHYHKPGGLNKWKFILSTVLKARSLGWGCQQGNALFEDSKGKFFLASPSFWW